MPISLGAICCAALGGVLRGRRLRNPVEGANRGVCNALASLAALCLEALSLVFLPLSLEWVLSGAAALILLVTKDAVCSPQPDSRGASAVQKRRQKGNRGILALCTTLSLGLSALWYLLFVFRRESRKPEESVGASGASETFAAFPPPPPSLESLRRFLSVRSVGGVLLCTLAARGCTAALAMRRGSGLPGSSAETGTSGGLHGGGEKGPAGARRSRAFLAALPAALLSPACAVSLCVAATSAAAVVRGLVARNSSLGDESDSEGGGEDDSAGDGAGVGVPNNSRGPFFVCAMAFLGMCAGLAAVLSRRFRAQTLGVGSSDSRGGNASTEKSEGGMMAGSTPDADGFTSLPLGGGPLGGMGEPDGPDEAPLGKQVEGSPPPSPADLLPPPAHPRGRISSPRTGPSKSSFKTRRRRAGGDLEGGGGEEEGQSGGRRPPASKSSPAGLENVRFVRSSLLFQMALGAVFLFLFESVCVPAESDGDSLSDVGVKMGAGADIQGLQRSETALLSLILFCTGVVLGGWTLDATDGPSVGTLRGGEDPLNGIPLENVKRSPAVGDRDRDGESKWEAEFGDLEGGEGTGNTPLPPLHGAPPPPSRKGKHPKKPKERKALPPRPGHPAPSVGAVWDAGFHADFAPGEGDGGPGTTADPFAAAAKMPTGTVGGTATTNGRSVEAADPFAAASSIQIMAGDASGPVFGGGPGHGPSSPDAFCPSPAGAADPFAAPAGTTGPVPSPFFEEQPGGKVETVTPAIHTKHPFQQPQYEVHVEGSEEAGQWSAVVKETRPPKSMEEEGEDGDGDLPSVSASFTRLFSSTASLEHKDTTHLSQQPNEPPNPSPENPSIPLVPSPFPKTDPPDARDSPSHGEADASEPPDPESIHERVDGKGKGEAQEEDSQNDAAARTSSSPIPSPTEEDHQTPEQREAHVTVEEESSSVPPPQSGQHIYERDPEQPAVSDGLHEEFRFPGPETVPIPPHPTDAALAGMEGKAPFPFHEEEPSGSARGPQETPPKPPIVSDDSTPPSPSSSPQPNEGAGSSSLFPLTTGRNMREDAPGWGERGDPFDSPVESPVPVPVDGSREEGGGGVAEEIDAGGRTVEEEPPLPVGGGDGVRPSETFGENIRAVETGEGRGGSASATAGPQGVCVDGVSDSGQLVGVISGEVAEGDKEEATGSATASIALVENSPVDPRSMFDDGGARVSVEADNRGILFEAGGDNGFTEEADDAPDIPPSNSTPPFATHTSFVNGSAMNGGHVSAPVPPSDDAISPSAPAGPSPSPQTQWGSVEEEGRTDQKHLNQMESPDPLYSVETFQQPSGTSVSPEKEEGDEGVANAQTVSPSGSSPDADRPMDELASGDPFSQNPAASPSQPGPVPAFLPWGDPGGDPFRTDESAKTNVVDATERVGGDGSSGSDSPPVRESASGMIHSHFHASETSDNIAGNGAAFVLSATEEEMNL
uniref:Transmembrane protein n=1 Tax=Chromera velia CCMP2878 TaxID=1169474 RepID=A0A0G4HZZ3_9ALVE|eukprot:Cvel_9842.t1-p1 / transcript=Cvel_9842.t1 / gene=Cvel_9842 / organism=Chromera_velia_CCMP2878 / gene_product=hypothetical protein / transcript_product=hypothetical protein / location=Cvel_scaffold579:64815-71904(+) / protein_length=1449 / sequence_SO=supercontig / SO=protein_coding / is_pseudo=false